MGFFIEQNGITHLTEGSSLGIVPSKRVEVNTRTVFGQIDAFRKSSAVQSAITRRVNAFANLKVWAQDDLGKQVRNPIVKADLALLDNYNPEQNKYQFENQLCAYRDIFGVAYVFKSAIAGFPNTFDKYVVPNNLIQPLYGTNSDKLFQHKVTGYQITIGQGSFTLRPDEIEVSYDNAYGFTGFGLGESRLIALAEPISTLLAIGETSTVLSSDAGARGIITQGAKDIDMISAPFIDAEKKAVQAELTNYGNLRGQFKYIVMKGAASYVPLTAKTTDLDLTGRALDALIQILDRYGIPSIFASKEPRFKAMPEARKEMYTATIIPEATAHFDFLLKLQGVPERAWKYQPDWSHMDFFQEARGQAAVALNQASAALNALVTSGVVTTKEARAFIEPYLE